MPAAGQKFGKKRARRLDAGGAGVYTLGAGDDMIKQALEKLLMGLVAGAFGATILFVHPEGKPRLWDVLAGGGASSSAPVNVIWVDAPKPVNRMLVIADNAVVSDSPTAAAPAAAAAPEAQARPAEGWRRHLQGVMAFFDVTGPAAS